MQKCVYLEENSQKMVCSRKRYSAQILLRNKSDSSANKLQCSEIIQMPAQTCCNVQGPLRGIWIGERG